MNRPQARRHKQQQASRLPPAPPLEREAPELPPLPSAPRPIDAPPTSREKAPAATANAAALSRWLTPETLRSQFILTEILQPPLALRELGGGHSAL